MPTTGLDLAKVIVEGVFDLLKSSYFWLALAVALVVFGFVQREELVGLLRDGAEVLRSLR